MNNGFVYILGCEMYGDLAYENGAFDIIMLSKDYNKCLERLKDCLNDDVNDYDFIIEDGISVDDFIKENEEKIKEKENIYVDIYSSIEDYNCGCNSATYKLFIKYID